MHSFPLHFPLRSVIQLQYLDVLLKPIMDSWGFSSFSSSFTEYSQCYSNLPTTPSCIGNETPATYPAAPVRSRTSTHSHQINTLAWLTKKSLKMRPQWWYVMQNRDNSAYCFTAGLFYLFYKDMQNDYLNRDTKICSSLILIVFNLWLYVCTRLLRRIPKALRCK